MGRARTVAAGLAATGACLLGPAAAAPAAAEGQDPEDVVTGFDMRIDLADDGVAHVTLDLEVDFGQEPNHGPYLTFLAKERYDDTRDRVYRYEGFGARSRTAPDAVDTEDGAVVVVRVGDEDEEITGTHAYTVTYRVEGLVNSASFDFVDGAPADDELHLDVITDWQVPVEGVSIAVTGPAEVLDAACTTDRRSDESCDAADVDGALATFSQRLVEPGAPLTVAVAYPVGTFGGVEPVLQDRWAFDRAFALTPTTGGVAAVVLLLGGALVMARIRRDGRDEAYIGLTPGLTPTGADPGTIGARQHGPTTVQFSPPEGLRPGQIGTLVDETADPHDVTATIVDLAVRGHLRIVRVDAGGPTDAADAAASSGEETDWRLERSLTPPDDLLPYEAELLEALFADDEVVTLSDLRTTFAASMATVQQRLYEDVTERGWFRRNPHHARSAWAGAGSALLAVGVVATVLLAIWTSWALVGVAVVLLGVLVLALTGAAPARTADGSAVLAQAEGFRHYLATAEADQLRFEEGEDLFSRYLPYAVAFGLTERWARLFADLAAQGRPLPEPTWFVGGVHGVPFWAAAGSLGSDLSAFTSTADSALTAPTPGASGGSGTSGGSFGGGGVSGGGGGTW